jgi:hypothetical protein
VDRQQNGGQVPLAAVPDQCDGLGQVRVVDSGDEHEQAHRVHIGQFGE